MDIIVGTLWTLLLISIIACFMASRYDRKKEEKMIKRLKETPVEVYRYTYKVYLNDGSNYLRTSVGWFTFSFEEFIKRCILSDDTLRIHNEIIVNTENISKFELIEVDLERIKPILRKCYRSTIVKEIYYPEEVVHRTVLNK